MKASYKEYRIINKKLKEIIITICNNIIKDNKTKIQIKDKIRDTEQ